MMKKLSLEMLMITGFKAVVVVASFAVGLTLALLLARLLPEGSSRLIGGFVGLVAPIAIALWWSERGSGD